MSYFIKREMRTRYLSKGSLYEAWVVGHEILRRCRNCTAGNGQAIPNYSPGADGGVASSPAWFEMCSLEMRKADELSSRVSWIFGALCQREFTCGSGNKNWDELWVNCQGKGALPWAHPFVSRAGEMTHGVH